MWLLTVDDAHGKRGPTLGIGRNIGGQRGHVTGGRGRLLCDGDAGQSGYGDEERQGADALGVHNASEETALYSPTDLFLDSFSVVHRVYFSLFTKAEVDEQGCFHAYVCLHFSAFLHGLE